MTAVEVEQLTKRFDTVTAVDAIDLRIEPGELFFLLGPSGCGKTTLLRMIAGFVEPTNGRILVDGEDVTKKPPSDRGMAMVFQSYALWPHMSVRDNVAYGLKIKKTPRAELNARVDEALEIAQLSELAARKPNALSGGQQQRVALARALVVRPRVILLDEPLSNLDARLRQDMRAEIRRICKDAGLTGLYVTHDQDEALSMADRIALLRSGQIVQCGPPRELYSRPATEFTATFLGDTNLINATVKGVENGLVTLDTPLGTLASSAWSGDMPPTGAVRCSIRPEAIMPGGVGPNQFQAAALSSVFLGERVRYALKAANDVLVEASIARPDTATIGEEASTFAIDPSEIVVVGD